jgi:hypothetical protein
MVNFVVEWKSLSVHVQWTHMNLDRVVVCLWGENLWGENFFVSHSFSPYEIFLERAQKTFPFAYTKTAAKCLLFSLIKSSMSFAERQCFLLCADDGRRSTYTEEKLSWDDNENSKFQALLRVFFFACFFFSDVIASGEIVVFGWEFGECLWRFWTSLNVDGKRLEEINCGLNRVLILK